MSMPREENMRGSQSMKLMWISGSSEPFLGLWDQTAASRRTKKASENWVILVSKLFHGMKKVKLCAIVRSDEYEGCIFG